MNPDNPYQPTPSADAPPTEPTYGAPVPRQPIPSTAPTQPSQTAPQPAPVAQPSYVPNNAPLPQPVPLGAAAVQNSSQTTGSQDQYSVDYLNQIAPVQKRTTNRFAIIALIAGVLIAAIIAVVVLANAGPPDFSVQAKDVQSRIDTLQTVADGQQTHLKENAVSEANSSLASALTSMNTELVALMKTKGIKASDTTKKTVTKTEKAYADALTKKLDDSYQRGTLDRTYATQMTYELSVLRSKLNRMKNTANSKLVTAYVTAAVTNIDAILKAYNAFSATK